MLYFIGHAPHHGLPPAQSWWCFRHWALIRQRPQRNYHKEHHRWRRSTPQPNLWPKGGLGMSSSLLPANDEDAETAIKNHKGRNAPEDPDDRRSMNPTSANVFDWWMLLVSKTSCSFCLSWDRVSCTDFREASTAEEKKGRDFGCIMNLDFF